MATRQIEFVDDNGFKATFELGSTLTADRVIAIPDQSGTLFSGVGGGISALVDDLTPQLGGNLDTNGQTINNLSYPTTDGTSGQVLTTDGAGNLTFTTVSGGGGGEANTASNVGVGTGLFKQKTGVDLEFKSISGGTGISLSGVDTITLAVTEGDLTLDNLSGTLGVAKGGTGATTAGNARTNLGIGTMGEQNATAVNIDGGNIDGTVIGATDGKAGSFSAISMVEDDGNILVYSLPIVDGTSGQVMTTNGAGVISWADAGGGGSSLSLYSENPSSPTTPIATGSNAVAIGTNSTAADSYCVAIGNYASANGGWNTVAIGDSATVSGTGADNSVAMNRATIQSATDAFAVGLNDIDGGGDYAISLGHRARSYNKGQFSHACGYETGGYYGDYQVSKYVYRGRTTSATSVNLWTGPTGGTTTVLAFPNYSTFLVSAQIVAAKDDYTEAAAYEIKGLYRYDSTSGNTNLVGSLNKTVIAEDVASWDATFTIDVLGRIQFNVTGEASKTINWTANVTVTEVAV